MSSAALNICSEGSCKLIYTSTSRKSGATLTSALPNAKSRIGSALAQIITDELLHVSDVLFVCDSADTGCTKWMQLRWIPEK